MLVLICSSMDMPDEVAIEEYIFCGKSPNKVRKNITAEEYD